MMGPTVFIDTETTGLWPHLGHMPWEVAVIVEDHPEPSLNGEWVWHLPVDLGCADPFALKLGGFHARNTAIGQLGYLGTTVDPDVPLWCRPNAYAPVKVFPEDSSTVRGGDLITFVRTFTRLTTDAVWVGVNPAFDQAMLIPLLVEFGHPPQWHHRSIDVTTLLAGVLHERGESIALPFKSEQIAAAAGVAPPAEEDRHTALGDARWVKAQYETAFKLTAVA